MAHFENDITLNPSFKLAEICQNRFNEEKMSHQYFHKKLYHFKDMEIVLPSSAQAVVSCIFDFSHPPPIGKVPKLEIKLPKTNTKPNSINGRRPQWKTTSMEDNLNGRQP